MTAARELDPGAAQDASPVELTARVAQNGDQFVATVDGLDLQASGRTRDSAENALVQAMRGWLERQDTTGRLAQALAVEHLDEDTEIVMRFVDHAPADQEPTG